MKSILTKLGSGFLYGVGFMMAAGIAGAMAYAWIDADIKEKQAQYQLKAEQRAEEMRSMYRDYDESAQLTVSITKERIAADQFTLLGRIENNGDGKWESINIKAELFNAAGEFINECEHYIRETSTPGSTINFKLSCGSCS
jgi:hypothetical protein